MGEPGELPAAREDGSRWHTTVGRRTVLDRVGAERLAHLLDRPRGAIVAGEGCGDPEAVLDLASVTGWPVLADPRSGCWALVGGAGHGDADPDGPVVVTAFDPILRHPVAAERLAPEVVLALGAPPASKVLGAWRRHAGALEVAVDAHGRWFDPDHRAAHVLHADPTAVCRALACTLGEPDASWTAAWRTAEAAAHAAIDEALATEDLPSEPGLARIVLGALPAGSSLVVSSSMPVRDLEWFGRPGADVRVLANRGANGIDGVVSTAIGVAVASRATRAATAVVVGDVALLHDSTALVGLAARDLDLTIVVVDNDGGGIFSFLPQAEALEAGRFEQLFGTPHGVDLSVLATAHGLLTVEPAGADDVATAIAACAGAGGARLVRVATDRGANVDLHGRIGALVAERVGAALGAG